MASPIRTRGWSGSARAARKGFSSTVASTIEIRTTHQARQRQRAEPSRSLSTPALDGPRQRPFPLITLTLCDQLDFAFAAGNAAIAIRFVAVTVTVAVTVRLGPELCEHGTDDVAS